MTRKLKIISREKGLEPSINKIEMGGNKGHFAQTGIDFFRPYLLYTAAQVAGKILASILKSQFTESPTYII